MGVGAFCSGNGNGNYPSILVGPWTSRSSPMIGTEYLCFVSALAKASCFARASIPSMLRWNHCLGSRKPLPIDKFKIQAGFDALAGVCAAIYLSVRKAKRNPRLPIVAGAMASVVAVIDDYASRQSRHSENPET